MEGVKVGVFLCYLHSSRDSIIDLSHKKKVYLLWIIDKGTENPILLEVARRIEFPCGEEFPGEHK